MNRFVKNNLVLIIVLGLSLVVTVGLLVWTTMQYLQMLRYSAQTEELREEIAKLIKKTPAPVEGNVKPIETDRELYSRLAAQIRKPFGHPLQPALEGFIKVLRRPKGEPITIEKFKEEFAAVWNKSDSFAEKDTAYIGFQHNFRNWSEAMNVFRKLAAEATAEPINDGNIDEIFQCALGVPRKLGGKPENLQRMSSNFQEGILALTKDKIQFESSFADLLSNAAPASETGSGEKQSGDQANDYPMIAQHWEILSDIVKRSTQSGIQSFVDFRKRSVQPEKSGSFDVFHYSITVTGTMESIRNLTRILDQAYEDNRVYIVRSVFLYRQDDALQLVNPQLAVEKEAAESRRTSMPDVSPRRGRRRSPDAPRESSEEQRKREQEERQAQEIAEREKSLPYYSRSGYGDPVIGKSDLIRAIVDVEYVMESGGGI